MKSGNEIIINGLKIEGWQATAIYLSVVLLILAVGYYTGRMSK